MPRVAATTAGEGDGVTQQDGAADVPICRARQGIPITRGPTKPATTSGASDGEILG